MVANTYLEGNLQRGLSAHLAGRRGAEAAVQAVLLSRRHSQPRRAGNARLDSRRRRTGLLAVARLRRGVRQSRSDRGLRRRRRRSRNRPAGDQLALEQVPQSGPRRRRAADPASERLQDRRPDRAGAHSARGAGGAVPRLRLHAVFRRGRRPDGRCTNGWRRRSTRWSPRSAASSGRPRERVHGASALADDHPALAEGLDRPEGRRRQADRGHLPLASGADGRHEPSRST